MPFWGRSDVALFSDRLGRIPRVPATGRHRCGGRRDRQQDRERVRPSGRQPHSSKARPRWMARSMTFAMPRSRRARIGPGSLPRCGVGLGPRKRAALRPADRRERFERLFFFPDPRGVTLKQVQGLLAEPAPSSSDIQNRSVALQGLPALEILLAGTGSDALATSEGKRRCGLASEVSANVRKPCCRNGLGLGAGQPFLEIFAIALRGQRAFRSETEVEGEVVKALSTTLRFTLSAEIAPPLGDDVSRANGKRALSGAVARALRSWRSARRRPRPARGIGPRGPHRAGSAHVVQSFRFEVVNASLHCADRPCARGRIADRMTAHG